MDPKDVPGEEVIAAKDAVFQGIPVPPELEGGAAPPTRNRPC